MTKRLFIAINLPQEVRNRLENYQEILDKKALPVRWLKNHNLHLTLKFLGEIDNVHVSTLTKTLRDFCLKYPKLSLETGDINAFPNFAAPRVIVLELEKNLALEEMAANLNKIIDSLGLPIKQDKKAFRSHITLARVKGLSASWGPLSGEKFIEEFDVTSVELMESILTPEHAQYKVVESFPLAG